MAPSREEKQAALAKRLRAKTFTALPGCFEMISARIADSFDFPAGDSRDKHSQVCFSAGRWESAGYIFRFTFGGCQF